MINDHLARLVAVMPMGSDFDHVIGVMPIGLLGATVDGANPPIARRYILVDAGKPEAVCIGRTAGKVEITSLADLSILMEPKARRPKRAPWLDVRDVARTMAYLEPRLGVAQ